MATISWFENTIVDWANTGKQYFLDGTVKQLWPYHYGFGDAAIVSNDGVYAFVYKRLATKGLLLKNGELLREINRSYYCSDAYEYPAIFITINKSTYLVHCPIAYNQLDFEDVESGELITNSKDRKPSDVFHSRLEISHDNSLLMSKGWYWHPLDVVNIFNIEDCIRAPTMLDNAKISDDMGTEICTASFIDSDKVLIGSSDEVYNDEDAKLPPKSIAIWDLKTNQISSPTAVNSEFGNLYSIDDDFAWDLYKYPKIINIKTGDIVDSEESVNSGTQRSSIIHSLDSHPQIIFNRETKQIAISGKERIEVLTPELQY